MVSGNWQLVVNHNNNPKADLMFLISPQQSLQPALKQEPFQVKVRFSYESPLSLIMVDLVTDFVQKSLNLFFCCITLFIVIFPLADTDNIFAHFYLKQQQLSYLDVCFLIVRKINWY